MLRQETEDQRHKRIIEENLKENLTFLEEQIYRYIDPSAVPPQLLFKYFIQQQRVDTLDSMLPINYLVAIDAFEEWYEKKGLPIPNQDWLYGVRKFWEEHE